MRAQQSSIGKHPVRSLLFLTNPTMILLGALLLMFSWRVPTNVQIEATLSSSEKLRSQPVEELIASLQNRTLLIIEGQILYPDWPDRAVVHFAAPERLEFSGQDLQVTILEHPTSRHWHIRLEGVVSSVNIVTPDRTTDLRLTQFDRLKASPMLVWAGGGLWLLATIFGWIRVFQALNA